MRRSIAPLDDRPSVAPPAADVMVQGGDLRIPPDTPLGMGNCGIIAVAMLAGVSHDVALAAVDNARLNRIGTRALKKAELSRGFGDEWRGATTQMMRDHALQALGVGFETRHAQDGGEPRRQLRTMMRRLGQGETCMVSVRGHTMILRDGRIFDQESPAGVPAGGHWCARRVVTFICRRTA